MPTMTQQFRSLEERGDDWCLAMSVAPDVPLARVEVPDLGAVILRADGQGGWWAVAERCQRCGVVLEPESTVTATSAAIGCVACGAAHGPHEPGCVCIATLVVDDEVYLLRNP